MTITCKANQRKRNQDGKKKFKFHFYGCHKHALFASIPNIW